MKRKLRRLQKKMQHSIVHFVRKPLVKNFTPEDVHKVFEKMGIKKDDIVFVNSAVNGICRLRPSGQTSREHLVSLLKAMTESVRTLILPSFCVKGRSIDYWKSEPIYNILETPGRTGYLTEVFRTGFPDVKRTNHPSEPVLLWGDYPSQMATDHKKCTFNPYSDISPLKWVYNNNGKLIRFGLGVNKAPQIIHLADAMINDIVDFNYLIREKMKAIIVNPDGSEEIIYGFPYNSDLTRLYNRRSFINTLGSENYVSLKYKLFPFSSVDIKPAVDRAVMIGVKAVKAGYLPPWFGNGKIKIAEMKRKGYIK